MPWLAFPCFTLFGVATNIGWHVVLSSLDYYNINLDYGEFRSTEIYNPLHNAGCLVMSLISVCIGDKIGYRVGLVGGFGIQLVLTLLLPWTPYLGLGQSGAAAYFCICAVVVGMLRGFVQGTIIGYSSMFPTYALGGMSLGQALSGFISSFFRCMSIIFLPISNEPGHIGSFVGTVVYYCAASTIYILCIVMFLQMENTSWARYHKRKFWEATSPDRPSLQSKEGESPEHRDQRLRREELKMGKGTFDDAWKDIWWMSIQIFLTDFLTYSMYPLINLKAEVSFAGGIKAWNLVSHVMSFCILNVVGKIMTTNSVFMTPDNVIWFTLMRALFTPFTLLLAKAWIVSDALALLNAGMLGMTYGIGSSHLFIFVPRVGRKMNVKKASFIFSCFKLFGLFLGASSSVAYNQL